MKSMVVVSREWHKPNIELKVTDKELSCAMTLEDFLKVVLKEAGAITWQFNHAKYEEKVHRLAEDIVDKMKLETRRIV